MSDLRRRAVKETPRDGKDNDETNPAARGESETKNQNAENHREYEKDEVDEKPTLSPIIKLKRYITKPRGKRRHSLVFLLGGIFGIFIALFFANHNEVISLDALMDLNLDSLIDVIPSGILSDAREFTVRLFLLKSAVKSC